jgi:hypothetical protein
LLYDQLLGVKAIASVLYTFIGSKAAPPSVLRVVISRFSYPGTTTPCISQDLGPRSARQYRIKRSCKTHSEWMLGSQRVFSCSTPNIVRTTRYGSWGAGSKAMIAFRASAGLVCSQKPAPEKFVTQWTLRTGLFAGSCAAGDVAPDRLVGTARRADSSQDRSSGESKSLLVLYAEHRQNDPIRQLGSRQQGCDSPFAHPPGCL